MAATEGAGAVPWGQARIGVWMRATRERLGISAERLAAAGGWTAAYLRYVETGQRACPSAVDAGTLWRCLRPLGEARPSEHELFHSLAVEAVWWAWTAPHSILAAVVAGEALTTSPGPNWAAIFDRNGYEPVTVDASGWPQVADIPRPVIVDACMAHIRSLTLGPSGTAVELWLGYRLDLFHDP